MAPNGADRLGGRRAVFLCVVGFVVFQRHPAVILFFFNDTATTEIYTLSLHDALPIYSSESGSVIGYPAYEIVFIQRRLPFWRYYPKSNTFAHHQPSLSPGGPGIACVIAG